MEPMEAETEYNNCKKQAAGSRSILEKSVSERSDFRPFIDQFTGNNPLKSIIGILEKKAKAVDKCARNAHSDSKNIDTVEDKEGIDTLVKGKLSAGCLGHLRAVRPWQKGIKCKDLMLNKSKNTADNDTSQNICLQSAKERHYQVPGRSDVFDYMDKSFHWKQVTQLDTETPEMNVNKMNLKQQLADTDQALKDKRRKIKTPDHMNVVAQVTGNFTYEDASSKKESSEETIYSSVYKLEKNEVDDLNSESYGDKNSKVEVNEKLIKALNTSSKNAKDKSRTRGEHTNDDGTNDDNTVNHSHDNIKKNDNKVDDTGKIQDTKIKEELEENSVDISSAEAKSQKKSKDTTDPDSIDCDMEEPSANMQSMYMHIPMHNDEDDTNRPHKCQLCNRGFKRASHVKRHMSIHTGEKKFKCEVCGKCFTTLHYLKLHDRLHTGEKPHGCEICFKRFTHYSNYKIHLRSHTDERPYPCLICGKSYTGSSHLKRHLLIHSGDKPHKCEICSKDFAQPSQLKSHMLSHSGFKPFGCTVCDKKFAQTQALGKHMLHHAFEVYKKESVETKTESDENENSDTCPDNELENGKTNMPTSLKQKKCKICHEDFSEKSSMKTHMLMHMGQKPYTCTFCERQFIELTNLKQHMFIHTGEKPFSCEHCGREFTQQSNLKSHLRIHTGERPYKCEICGKTFAHSSSLKNHFLFHTGETRHHCHICGKGFTDTSSLKKHVRTHTGEKPYKCTFCGRGFAASSSMKTHMFTHGGPRPYKCDQCTKQFARPSQLEKHLFEKHKIKRTIESLFNKPTFDHSKDSLAKPVLGQSIKEIMEGIKESKEKNPECFESTNDTSQYKINSAMDKLTPVIERAIEAVDRKIILEQTSRLSDDDSSPKNVV